MRHRSLATEDQASATPTCWQREGSSACLRIELPSGQVHLFPYQHLVTASCARNDDGEETIRVIFSTHELEVKGRGLRELVLSLQDFAVKWVRMAPARYYQFHAGCEGLITAIRLTAVE